MHTSELSANHIPVSLFALKGQIYEIVQAGLKSRHGTATTCQVSCQDLGNDKGLTRETFKAWPVDSVERWLRQFSGRQKNFNGEQFWAGATPVSTVGFEEGQIRTDIRHQEQLDGRGSDEDGEC